MRLLALFIVAGSVGLAGCSSSSVASGSSPSSSCGAGLVSENGACIDPLRRFEPSERVDVDNVVSYGNPKLTMKLPDPPKSGFRLIVTPRTLEPSAEVEDCQAWAYPNIKNKNVYAARIYTTQGLHHSNVYGVPLAPSGPSPYPACTTGQADVATQVPNMLLGNIMDVLFANSTQIQGGEQIVFPKGMAFKITTDGREVAATIHWLNVTTKEITTEVVYDFFTTSDDNITTQLVPFVYENEAFSIAPHSTGTISMTCNLVHGGNIVTIMPHTHRQTTAFSADIMRADGSTESLFEQGAFDGESHITVLNPPISLDGFTKIHHQCTVNNNTTTPIVWGIGANEMCTLFGYLYQPQDQQMGVVIGPPNPDGSSPACLTLDLGVHRPAARDH